MNFSQVVRFAVENDVQFLADKITGVHCAEILLLEDYKCAYEAVVAELLFLQEI